MKEIVLDLRVFCIETATKRFYNHLLSEYFSNKKEDEESEKKLDMLQKAMTYYDFSSLRSIHKELAGKSNARIALINNTGNIPSITIDNRIIDMKAFIKNSDYKAASLYSFAFSGWLEFVRTRSKRTKTAIKLQ